MAVSVQDELKDEISTGATTAQASAPVKEGRRQRPPNACRRLNCWPRPRIPRLASRQVFQVVQVLELAARLLVCFQIGQADHGHCRSECRRRGRDLALITRKIRPRPDGGPLRPRHGWNVGSTERLRGRSNGTRARTVVPAPGFELMDSSPSTSFNRSVMLVRPSPRALIARWSKPAPASTMVSSICALRTGATPGPVANHCA